MHHLGAMTCMRPGGRSPLFICLCPSMPRTHSEHTFFFAPSKKHKQSYYVIINFKSSSASSDADDKSQYAHVWGLERQAAKRPFTSKKWPSLQVSAIRRHRRAEFLKCIFYYSAFSRNVTFLKQAVIMRSPCQLGASEEQDFISAFLVICVFLSRSSMP